MILTPKEYCQLFRLNNKQVSAKTVQRRCEKEQLPHGHKARRVRGAWVIEVKEN